MRGVTGILFLIFCLFSLNDIVFAGSKEKSSIGNRQKHQEQSIQEGVASGQLTKKEAATLEAQQSKIEQDEAQMKEDGKLTNSERKKLKRELKKAKKNINRKLNNDKTADMK